MASDFVLLVNLTFPSPAASKKFSSTILEKPRKKCVDPFDGDFSEQTVTETLNEWENMGVGSFSIQSKVWTINGLYGEDAFNDIAPGLRALVYTACQAGAIGKAIACCVEFPDGYFITITENKDIKINRMKKSEAESIHSQKWFCNILKDMMV